MSHYFFILAQTMHVLPWKWERCRRKLCTYAVFLS